LTAFAAPLGSAASGDGAAAAAPAELQSPTDKAPLAGGRVTFSWGAGEGVSQYWLKVGTTTVANDVYDASQGTTQTATIAVPVDGGPIYVTISSLIDGQWHARQYIFQAALPP
jgi:hypothetical protein